jgi:hypothetical protein
VTGSGVVPVGGFKNLQGMQSSQLFTIQKVPDRTQLPSASTCVNMLKLPDYATYEELETKFLIALKYSESFGLK